MARKFEDAMNRVRNGETRGYGVSSSYDDEEEKRKERSFETALKKRGSFNHFNNSSQPTTYETPGYAARNYSTPSLMPESTNPYDIALASVTLRNATQPQRVTANGMKETYEKYGPITQSSLPIIQSQMEAEDNFRKAATRQEMLNKKPEYPTLVNLPTGKDDHSYLPGNEYSNYNSMDLALMKAYYENHKPGEQAAIDYAERMNSFVPGSGDEWLSATQSEIDRKDKVYEETGKLWDVLPQAQFNTPALNAQNNYDIAKDEWNSKLNEINYAIDSNYYNSVYNAADFDTLKNYNPEAAKTSEAQQIAAALNDDAQRNALDQYKYIKPDEIEVFNYLLNKDGDEKALDYLSKLNLTERRTSAITDIAASAAHKDPVKASAGALAIGVFKGIGILGSAADYIAGNEIDPNAWYNLPSNIRNAVVGQVSQDIEAANEGFMGKVGSFMYGTGMSMGDFVLSLATGNEAAALAIMGAGAASDTTIEAKKRGLSDGQALAIGAIAGAAEVVSEKVSIEALFNSDVKGVQYILKNALAEGGEEVESDLINTMADLIISGDKNEMNMTVQNYMAQGYSKEEAFGKMLGELAIQYGIDFAGGAISGAAMGAVGSQANYFYENKAGATLNNDETAVNDIVNLGLKSENQATVDLANKVANGQAENYELGRLYAEVNKENNITGKVVDYLMENGETQGRAEEAAYVINKYMTADISENGQSNLTAKEQAILNKPVVQDAMNTVFTDDYQKYADNLRTADDAYSRALEMARNNARPTRSGVDLSNVRSILGNNRSESTINVKDNEIKTDNTVETNTPSVNVVSEKTKYQPKLSEMKTRADAVNEYNNSHVQATTSDIASTQLTEDGLKVTLNNGQTVDADQIADTNTSNLLGIAYRNIADEQGINDFIQDYNKNCSVNAYMNAAFLMINAGKNGADIKTASDRVAKEFAYEVKQGYITQKFLNDMYTAGVNELKGIQKGMNSKTQMDPVNMLFGELGIKTEEADINERGSYNSKTNVITFGKKGTSSRIDTAGHEGEHFIEKYAPEIHKELRDIVLQSFKDNTNVSNKKYKNFYEERFAALLEQYKDKYENNEKLTEKIHSEMTARSMEEMLYDEDVIKDICEKDTSLAEKIYNAIVKALKELRNIFHGHIGTEESQALAQDIEALERAKKLYAKGIKEASENAKKTNAKNTVSSKANTINNENIKENSSNDTIAEDEMYSLNDKEELTDLFERIKARDEKDINYRSSYSIGNLPEIYKDVLDLELLNLVVPAGHIYFNLVSQEEADNSNVDYDPDNTHFHKIKPYRMAELIHKLADPKAFYIDINNNKEYKKPRMLIRLTDKWFAAMELYSNNTTADGSDRLNHATITVFDPKDVKKYLRNYEDNVLYEKENHSQTEAANTYPYGSVKSNDSLIKDNIAKFKNIIKEYLEETQKNTKKVKRDNEGKILSKEQVQYFKDSVVRDEEGNLLRMYHGTPNGDFTVFKGGSYFTDMSWYADIYQGQGASMLSYKKNADNPKTYAVYLNITKPFDTRLPEVKKIWDEQFYRQWGTGTPLQENGLPDWTDAEDILEFIEENDLDYDGIIVDEGGIPDEKGGVKSRGNSWIPVNGREQVKAVDNLNPTDDEDIRFSLNEPVEVTKDLIAVHNLDEDKLLKAFELGGFAMPSIAVVKAKEGHTMYGDYSAVFNRDTIDPKKSKLNKIYGSDAYTPTTPQVDYLVDSKKNQQLINTLKDLSNKVDDYFAHDIRTFSSFAYEGESRLSYDEILKKALDSKGMKAAYLESIGEHVNPVQEEVEETLSFDGKEDFYKKILDTYSKERRSDLHELTGQEYMDKYTLDDIKEAVEKNIGKKFPENSKFAKDVVRRNFFNLRDYDSYIKGELKPKKWMSINAEMTNKAIDEKVDKTEYKKWLESILDGIISGAGIHNGTETFTYAGNRRGFWQTHNKYTLDNLVAAMKKLQSARGERASMTLAQGLQSVVSPEFKSITDLKKNTKNLGQKDKAEYDAILKDINDRIREITAYIYENSNISRYVSGDDLIDKAILNSIKTKSVEQVIKNFEKENLVISEEMAQKLLDIIEDVRNIPTGYFEAKPNRAVGFDEIAYMVIPDDAPQEIIDKLNENNIPYEEYKAMDKQDRIDKLNSHNDVRFAFDDPLADAWDDVFSESEEEKAASGEISKNTANILEEGFGVLKSLKDAGKTTISHNKATQIAKRYIDKYDSATGIDKLASNIESVFAYISENDVKYDDMLRVMRDVTMPVVENMKGDEYLTQEYKDFVKTLKNTSVSLDESQKREIVYAYGSMTNFRRAVAGRFNIKEDAPNIDSVWQDIVEESGYRLAEDENSNTQAIALVECLDQMKEDKGANELNKMTANQLALDMALNIYTDYFKEMSQSTAKANEIEVARRLAHVKDALRDSVNKYEEAVDKMYKKMLADTKAQAQAEIDRLTQELRELNNIDTYNRSIDTDKRIVQLKRQIDRLKQQQEEDRVYRKTSRQKARENRENSRMRNAIKSIVKDLSSRLANPNKNRYVPEDLVQATIDMLESINLDTKEGNLIKEKVQKVKDAYERLGKSTNESDASDDYDPALYNMITRLKEIFDKGKSVRRLSQSELEDVLTIAKAIQTQVKNANELIKSEIAQKIDETARGVIEDVRANKEIGNGWLEDKVNRGVNTVLDPRRFLNRLVGYNEDSKMMQLFDELNEGQHKMMQIQMETSEIFNGILENETEARKLTGENEEDWVETPFKDKKGNPLKIPAGMRLSLAMHMLNEDNLRHIIYGGLTVPDMKLYNQGRKAEAYKKAQAEIRLIDDNTRLKLYEMRDKANELNDEKYTNQEREDAWAKYRDTVKKAEDQAKAKLQSIVDGMTDYERQFLEYAKEYFWNYSGKQINETSMALNGYMKATVENYFPIATDTNYSKRDIEGLKLDQTLEGWGNLKSRVHAKNPIFLENIVDVISKHSDMMSKYAGFAIPIRNFNKVYNYNLRDNGSYKDSVKNAINSQRGIAATEYIENLLTDLQGSRKGSFGEIGKSLDKLRGNFAAATLTANLGVAIKQAASIYTAADVLGHDAIAHVTAGTNAAKHFWKSFTHVHKLDNYIVKQMEEIKKYSPLVWYRNQGNSTQELKDLKNKKTVLDKFAPTRFVKDLTGNWIQNIDTATVTTLWEAAKYRISKDTDLEYGSEEYFREVAKIFNKAVEQTQPNYTTLQRPDILRNPNELVKNVIMFATQPLQNLGICVDSTANYMAKYEAYKNNQTEENKAKLDIAGKRLARSLSAVAVSMLVFSLMQMVAKGIRHKVDDYRDENGELTFESVLSQIMRDFGSSAFGMVPLGSEIYDALVARLTGGKYYGFEVSTIKMVTDFFESAVNLFDATTDFMFKGEAEKLGKSIKNFVFNTASMAGIPVKNLYNLGNGVVLFGQDFKKLINGEPWFFESGYTRSNTVNQNRLYEAMISGDNDKFDDVYAEMLQNGLTPDKIYGGSGSAGLMVKDDLLNGNIDVNTAVDYLEKLGAEDASEKVTEWVKDDTKEKFEAGTIDEEEAEEALMEAGMGANDAHFKVQEWETGSKSAYIDVNNAISSGDPEAIVKAVNEMLEYGYTKDRLKGYSGISENFKEQYIDLYHTNKTEAASLKSAILTYYQACGMSREDAAKKVDKWVE